MISKIEAVGYRCLQNVSQTLGNFHILAGPNGSGKSTFIGIPFVLGQYARDGLASLWDATLVRSFEELLFCGQGTSFQLAAEAVIPSEFRPRVGNGNRGELLSHLRYEVEIGRSEEDPTSGEPRILAENLWLMPGSQETPRSQQVQLEFEFPSTSHMPRTIVHPRAPAGWRKVASKTARHNAYFRSENSDWNFQIRNPEGRSALSTLPEDDRFASANWFKRVLAEQVQRIVLRSERMQTPSGPLRERRFASDGSNLPQVVRELRRDQAAYKGWIQHLRTVLPVKTVEVCEREEDRHLFLAVTFETGLRVKSWHLSDGTLRLFALTLLAYVGADTPIYLVEEPENGIYPQAIETVFQSLSSVYDGQVLVATHSPAFVAQAKPEHLLCFSCANNGSIDIVRGDRHPRLRQWQGEVSLSQLFAAGVLS